MDDNAFSGLVFSHPGFRRHIKGPGNVLEQAGFCLIVRAVAGIKRDADIRQYRQGFEEKMVPLTAKQKD
ncbi:hypothetical protein [Desulfobacter curvatus]|uniref:hypothetical protein n=1 Tax=Desulfobacter curvatus TaxID=2290 RepID=UPI000376F21E|nr:hypothetical protein [Desulfobacter curvatus]